MNYKQKDETLKSLWNFDVPTTNVCNSNSSHNHFYKVGNKSIKHTYIIIKGEFFFFKYDT